jgi:hypothetical protein
LRFDLSCKITTKKKQQMKKFLLIALMVTGFAFNGEAGVEDLVIAARATVADFNGDGHPDYVLYRASTRQTAIWYLNNNIFSGSGFGPTLPAGWNLVAP